MFDVRLSDVSFITVGLVKFVSLLLLHFKCQHVTLDFPAHFLTDLTSWLVAQIYNGHNRRGTKCFKGPEKCFLQQSPKTTVNISHWFLHNRAKMRPVSRSEASQEAARGFYCWIDSEELDYDVGEIHKVLWTFWHIFKPWLWTWPEAPSWTKLFSEQPFRPTDRILSVWP